MGSPPAAQTRISILRVTCSSPVIKKENFKACLLNLNWELILWENSVIAKGTASNYFCKLWEPKACSQSTK